MGNDVLTDKTLRALKPREKPYKRSDSRGLYVLVQPDGALWWRFRYRWQGREKLLSMGTYPDTSLKLARDKRDEARSLLAKGVDPSAARREERTAQCDTFEVLAREWLTKQRMKPTTIEQLRHRLESYAFREMGRAPVRTLGPADVLRTLRRIESRGRFETAHRVRAVVGIVSQGVVYES
jgi:hypothetical protein